MPQKPFDPYSVDYDTLMRDAKDALAHASAFDRDLSTRTPTKPEHYDSLEPVKRFGRGLKDMLLPTDRLSDVWEGPEYTARHPIEAAKLLFGADRDARARESQLADEAPTTSEYLGHKAASYLPVIGPSAASAGESFADGDIAGGFGKTAGLLAPFALHGMMGGEAERPVARVPDFEGGERNPGSVRPEPFGPEPLPKPKVRYEGRPQRQLKDLLGMDPQAFEAPEQGVGTPLEPYTASRLRIPFRPDETAPTSVPAEGYDRYAPNTGAPMADTLADARPRIPFRGMEDVAPRPESPLPAGFEELNRIINAPEGRLTRPERAPLAPPQTDVNASISDALTELAAPAERAPAPLPSPEPVAPEPPVQEPTPFIDNEQPPASNKPRLSADDVAGMLRGRDKFAEQNPNAELPPGARDELDRSGVEYNRTQRELKKLLGLPDADPAEVGRMRQGARELGSRLRNTAKAASTPPAPSEPPSSLMEMLQASVDDQAANAAPPGREGHFTLPEPSYTLPEEQQLKMLEETPARADERYNKVNRRGEDTGRAEGNRRADPETRARIEAEMNATAAAPPEQPRGGAPIPNAPDSPQFQAEFGPVDSLSKLLGDETGSVDFSELRAPTPEQRAKVAAAAQAHQAGSLLFNPLTLLRILGSNASAAVMKSLEHSANERSLAPTGRTIKELLNPQMITDAVDAFKEPHTQPTRDGSPNAGGGIFGLASRAIGAVDAPFRGAMERAGFPSEDALTVTQQRRPLTKSGRSALDAQQATSFNRLLVPFLKSKINEFETGLVEPAQSAGRLLTGEGQASDAVKVGAAGAAGAAGYAASDKLDDLPRPIRALVLAMSGLYATPAAIGYGAGHLKQGGTGAYNALINALPLAEGFSLDPRTQVNRVIPRILNPDYWTGTTRDTSTFWNKIKSQIPGLAQTLSEKRPPHHAAPKTAKRAPR
jgi:hypothetical protein